MCVLSSYMYMYMYSGPDLGDVQSLSQLTDHTCDSGGVEGVMVGVGGGAGERERVKVVIDEAAGVRK